MKAKPGILVFILCSCLLLSALNVRSVNAVGAIYIRADGSIEPPEAPIQTRDNITYTLSDNISDSILIERSNILVDGAEHCVQGDGTGNGFSLQDAGNVTIKNTIIQNCFDGIQLFNSANNIITGNTIVDSSYEGVGLYFSSNNIVAANRISNNQIGIALHDSSSNSVVHNDFANNTYQVYTESSANNWDNGYPSGGNYWSDYAGSDMRSGPYQTEMGSDGIGDTWYTCSENDADRYPLMQKWTNIAITAISSSKTAVGQGQKVNITIIVQDQGWDAVTTSVTLYANTTILSSFTNIALPGRTQTMLTYTWQTASFDKAKYVINANATAIPGETDNRDNTLVYSKTVAITITGDVNGDGAVDIYDAIVLANAYGSVPTSSNWNGNADINSDNVVDIYDAIILANNYGKKI
jgi:parallel beta-helix repeat protein